MLVPWALLERAEVVSFNFQRLQKDGSLEPGDAYPENFPCTNCGGSGTNPTRARQVLAACLLTVPHE